VKGRRVVFSVGCLQLAALREIAREGPRGIGKVMLAQLDEKGLHGTLGVTALGWAVLNHLDGVAKP